MFQTQLSAPVTPSQNFVWVKQMPDADSGYLVISPNTPKEEVIYYTSKTSGMLRLATSPAATTNPDGFGRGLDGTMAQDHDTNEPVEDYAQDEGDLTITYRGVSLTLKPHIKLSLPEKPQIKGIK